MTADEGATPPPGLFPTRPARRLTVFLTAHDRVRHRSAVVELVRRARHFGAAGATVFRGLSGYGHSGHLHHTHLLHDDAPETVVVVDDPERLDAFAESVRDLTGTMLVVVDDIEIVEL